MFDKEYRLKGRHAKRVNDLTSKFDEDRKASMFDRNVDVFINAPLVGFLYNRKAEIDETKNAVTGEVESSHIMGDRIMQSREELFYVYRLIILLDKNHEQVLNKRIDKAFRDLTPKPEDEELFYSYMRGGIDVLYEKLIENAVTPDDYAKKLETFITEFNDMFNKEIKQDEIASKYSK